MPISLGGKTELDNLCASCHACNNHKNDVIEAVDPETDTVQPIFNPRKQNWDDHFAWDEAKTQLIGLTPTGRATIIQLKINRPEHIISRQLWVTAGWHPPK